MEKLKDLLEATSLPGLPLLLKSKSLIVKLIWLLFISLFGTGCIFFTSKSLVDFFSYNTIANINIIKQNETQFPTVSFCETQNNSDFNIKILYLWFQNVNLIEDWQNHIESYSDSEYGRCYRFNSGFNWSNESIPI
jgi:hypothetical protein